MVYFIQNTANLMIKIGYTSGAPVQRLKALQTGHADRLELLGAVEGDKRIEKRLHKLFNTHRVTGEWFRPHEDVTSAIKTLLSPKAVEPPQLDFRALGIVSQRLGSVKDHNGEEYMFILPLDGYEDNIDFDKYICRCGLKKFARPRMPTDFPREIPQEELPRVLLVQELSPGIRGKTVPEIAYFAPSSWTVAP